MKAAFATVILTTGLVAFFLMRANTTKQCKVTAVAATDTTGIAVLELFTSQGCSSCPPADALLQKYSNGNNKNIIPLSFHVDYWNRLGWTDSFSNAAYSRRQQMYARSMNLSSVYTPQLVINGQKETVGSNATAIAAAINSEIKKKPAVSLHVSNLSVSSNKLSFNCMADGNMEGNEIVALLVQHSAVTRIAAGENDGATLTGCNIVRDLVNTDYESSKKIELVFPRGAITKEYKLVVMAQDAATGRINGAAMYSL